MEEFKPINSKEELIERIIQYTVEHESQVEDFVNNHLESWEWMMEYTGPIDEDQLLILCDDFYDYIEDSK